MAQESRQDDPVMTRARSASWASTSTGGAPPRSDDGDPLLRDVWTQVAVVATGWLILLGLTLLTLSTLAQQPPPAPTAAPGFSGTQPQQPGPGRETKR